ncbi:MAG: hypothetical protein JST04_04515 [Bdellovibrionales bacterium]|nr:hypothetical protein [Bdellovibrionales bacterium]
MKSIRAFALPVFLGLFTLHSAGAACPRLEGKYWCMDERRGELDLLTIGHRVLASGVHEYSFDYSTIPGDPDIVRADARGIPDGEGWITKCSRDDRLVSITREGDRMSVLRLDREHALVREFNEQVVQRCPRKQSPYRHR